MALSFFIFLSSNVIDKLCIILAFRGYNNVFGTANSFLPTVCYKIVITNSKENQLKH